MREKDTTKTFLRVHVVEDGIQIVNYVVKTQSYVAFLRMSKLASLLLFEYLEVRKLEDTSREGPAGSERFLFQGFSMFISSSNRIFSLTVQDVPARRVMPMVREGLKCLARLPGEAWEMMGPVCTAKDFLYGVAAKSMAAQEVLLQDDRTIDLDALLALSLLVSGKRQCSIGLALRREKGENTICRLELMKRSS